MSTGFYAENKGPFEYSGVFYAFIRNFNRLVSKNTARFYVIYLSVFILRLRRLIFRDRHSLLN